MAGDIGQLLVAQLADDPVGVQHNRQPVGRRGTAGARASGVPGPPLWFAALVIAFTAVMLFLSYWPVRNMLSPQQRMNMSFNSFHLGNTYGAFGSICRIRQEVVIEGTDEAVITDETVWKEYEFKGKPTDVRRLPRQFAPYHLRLDWLMWFAAISPGYALSWMTPFLTRLLRNDPATLRLCGTILS